jgi:hypothetical protein
MTRPFIRNDSTMLGWQNIQAYEYTIFYFQEETRTHRSATHPSVTGDDSHSDKERHAAFPHTRGSACGGDTAGSSRAASSGPRTRAAPRPDPPGRRSGSSAGTAPAAPRTRCPDAAAAVDVPDMGDDDVQCGEQRSRCPRAEWSGTAEASARLYVGVVSVCVTGIGLVVEPDAVNKGLFGADGCTRPHQPASGYWHGWYSSADRTGLSNPAI